MKKKHFKLIAILSINLLISCSSTKTIVQDNYIVLDKEGMQFTVYGSLEHKSNLNPERVKVNLKEAKKLTRKELGQYQIIEPCINKKDSIFTDIEAKVNILLNHLDKNSKYRIDSCTIDDFIKARIVEKFGDQYKDI